MTDINILASHLFHRFLGRNPTDQEKADLVQYGLGWDGYCVPDDRLFSQPANVPMLLLYSSCHCEQMLVYLKKYRPEVIDQYSVFILYTHRLLLRRGHFNLELIHAMFGQADAIITNPMNVKFEELSTIPLLKQISPKCKVVTFVPPSVSAFWPVVPAYGEEAVANGLLAGKTAEEMVQEFLAGTFECLFAQRYVRQLDRLIRREEDCHIPISGFIDKYGQSQKTFFTSNHPTFPIIGHITNQALSILGYGLALQDDILSLPVNGARFTNHFPETRYEWEFFGFTYPRQFEKDWGGPNVFYPNVIREAAAKMKDPETVLNNPSVPVELER